MSEKTYQDCGLRKQEVNAFVSRRSDPTRRKQSTATIEVTYGDNFSAEAEAAFERAVDVWETHISSPVPIQIQASYQDLGAGVIAAAGPTYIYGMDATGDGQPDAVVGDALAGALLGEAPQPGQPDIIVNLNSRRDDWHFGEGDAPEGTIDFTSVALHEIAHGLNYLDLFSLVQGEGQYFSDTIEESRVVGIYDRQVVEEQEDGSLWTLTDTTLYSNSSPELGAALEGGHLFFTGDASETTAALGDGPPLPKLYAPAAFAEGSSISHLAEDVYPFETQDALMTPFIAQAETNRQPGPLVCGQFRDMGWPLGPECEKYFRDLFAVEVREVEGQNGSLTLSWSEKEGADIQEYIVDRQYFDGAFEEVKRVDASQVTGTSLTVEDLGLGAFTFRLRWERADETVGTSPEQPRDTVTVRGVATDVTARDEQERETIDLSWAVPAGTSSDYVYRVERKKGEYGAFETVATVPQDERAEDEEEKAYTAERQTPGRYEYRVTAQDEAGNTVTSSSQEHQISFDGDVYALGPYPNPVRERATFDLTARQSQSVTVEVYDALGRQVYTERREVRAQASTSLSIDVNQWASGVYFLRLRGRTSVGETEKMVVVQ